jgi:nucleoside-diphosphate-sugar epimerase
VVRSIVDRHLVRRCMADVDAVIHTATLHKPPDRNSRSAELR